MNDRDRFFATLAKLRRYGTPEDARRLAYLASKSGARPDPTAGAHHRLATAEG